MKKFKLCVTNWTFSGFIFMKHIIGVQNDTAIFSID